ncbi:carboxylate-amine ligase [Chryseolinea lacunae]|uniref:Putative glutamate--cysteine ligase 2 n=1 Tax=Chryseolinea lacunae TaxID=2801331 RepID=A0ABS1KLD3_9BACT|nr:YbdK family carboxylate-amine ligase [Chryseolinea lacunae]MBL0740264.1 YbdK family carboxylate-amine ligase [Chryseolinea lacunae]
MDNKKKKPGLLNFKTSAKELTLGVELELQVLDGESLLLTPRANEVIDRGDDDKLQLEFFQSTLEVISGICANTHAVESDLKHSLQKVSAKAHTLNLKIASTATHPLADYRERLITPSKRYNELIDRNQWLIRRMAVYGMHVHIGMPSGDACIRYNYFFMHFLPHILALSGSSPFWQGKYTGLSSCRPTTYESLPTAGMPYLVKDWKEFQKLYRFLLRTQAIQSMKDLWWDLRPSPHYGTLELRFCDEPATLYETLGIVTFIHVLAHWFRDHEEEWTKSYTYLSRWIFRENKWRAIRYGLDAEMIPTRRGKAKGMRDDIADWIKKLEPYAQALNCTDYLARVNEIAQRGNSSERQTRVFQNTNDLEAVIRHNVAEFDKGMPIWT